MRDKTKKPSFNQQYFRKKVLEILEEEGKTLNWLATKTEITPDNIYKIQSNQFYNPTLKTMDKIAIALNRPLSFFVI